MSTLAEIERLKAQLEVVIKEDHWFTQRQVEEVLNGERPVQEFRQWKCLNPEACIVQPSNLTVTCAEGYQGPLCAVCDSNYGSAGGHECTKCQDSSVNWVLLVLILIVITVVAVLAIMRVLRKASKNTLVDTYQKRELLTTMKILFNFLQVLSFFSEFAVEWSTQVLNLFGTAGSTTGLSFNLSFIDCALGWNSRQRYVFIFILPFLIILIPAIAISLVLLWHQKKSRASEARQGYPLPPLLFWGVTPVGLYSTIVMVLLFLFYPTASRNSLLMVKCSKPIDGTQYITDDFTLSCEDSSHAIFSALAWIQLTLISFGFPIVSAGVLFYNRDKLHHDRIRRRFSFLYSGYDKTRYWYESVIMARKFGLIGAAVTLSDSSVGYQLFWGVTILVVSLLLHLWLRPFQDHMHGVIEQIALISLVFILLIGQLIAFQDLSAGMGAFLTSIIVISVCTVTLATLSVLVYDLRQIAKNSEFPKRLRFAFLKKDTRDSVSTFDSAQSHEIPELPSNSDWEKRTHPNGMVYYFNKKTHKSQWDKPAELEEAEDEQNRIASAWDIKQHPKYQLPYYVNYITREMKWERPQEMPLKPGECWEIRVDSSTGVPYFYNSLTDKTEWEKPEDFVPAPEQQAYLLALEKQSAGGPSAGPPPAIQGAAAVRSLISSKRDSVATESKGSTSEVPREDIPTDAFVRSKSRPFSERIGLNWIRDRLWKGEDSGDGKGQAPHRKSIKLNPMNTQKRRRATSHRFGPIFELGTSQGAHSARSLSTEARNSRTISQRNPVRDVQGPTKSSRAATFDKQIAGSKSDAATKDKRGDTRVAPRLHRASATQVGGAVETGSVESTSPRSEVPSASALTNETNDTVISVRGPWQCFYDNDEEEYYWVNTDTGATLWQAEFDELYESSEESEEEETW
eukprot:gb/GECG01015231.1/.p1 GENE.gb/GECG01015231.1/~~gb/GECG01015231.1/.p1  ORF type:complete len:909 (+),score=82.43 gb/GECG01015231.1/:1-2727(+)